MSTETTTSELDAAIAAALAQAGQTSSEVSSSNSETLRVTGKSGK